MKDKIVVITGAGRGLGKALADACTFKGAKVVVSDKDTADVTKGEDMEHLAQEVVSAHGKIDIWINNAGIWMPKVPINEVDIARAHELFNVNVFGTINGLRAAVPFMKRNGGGTIVNISSTTAYDGMSGSSSSMYVASKYAVRGFTNVMREELKDASIKVIGVYPGGMKTDIFDGATPAHIEDFMSAESVAQKIVDNLEKENPEVEQIITRPGQSMVYPIK